MAKPSCNKVKPIGTSYGEVKSTWYGRFQRPSKSCAVGSKMRKAAQMQPCSLRFMGCSNDMTTVVGCHIRFPNLGANLKLDSMMVFGCNHCHDILDGRKSTGMMEKEIQERIIYGLAETHTTMIDQGHMVLA